MAPSQQRLDQIRDLVNQWEQLAGFSITVPDWAISDMAGRIGDVSSLYDVGQYMAQHQRGHGEDPGAYFVPEWYAGMPWAKWGMSTTEYNRKLEEYDSGFRVLTGQAAPQDLIEKALHDHQGQMTMGQFEVWVQTQEALRNQYGWLRYGLDFSQFQTQKLQMRTGFGRDLTDAEAVTQLQYHHAAQGASAGVGVQPTLTQAEKKQAQTGLSGSVVR